MSTFAVFGMTKALAVELAKKRTPAQRTDTTAPGGRALIPLSEWLEAVDRKAAQILESSKPRQLSGMFDAPQYAQQFIDLARAAGECKGLHVRARAQLKSATGQILRDKKGAPRYGFREWDGQRVKQ